MGYAIQSIGLFPHWTVEDNIAAVPRLLKWPEARVAARVRELLDLLARDEYGEHLKEAIVTRLKTPPAAEAADRLQTLLDWSGGAPPAR